MVHLIDDVLKIKCKTNLNAFDVITRINKSTSLLKHNPCDSRCRFDGKKSDSKHK